MEEEKKVEEVQVENVEEEKTENVEETSSESVKENQTSEESINKEEEKDNGGKTKLIIIISVISVLLLLLLVIMIVAFYNKPKEVITDKQVGGEVNITYTDKNSTLNVVNLAPVEDSAAIKDLTGDNYFEFSVETKVKGAKEVNYEISVTKNADKSTINDSDIRIYLEKENSGSYAKVFGPSKFKGISKKSDLGTPKGSMVLAKVTNKKSVIENYRLKVWLANTSSPGTVPQNYSLDINLVGDAE